MNEPVRVAMWSGPRNLSTAMMRAFGQRPDTAVVDEPFYAAFLSRTGLDHPMREAVLASQPTDPDLVIKGLLGPAPGGRAVYYQKHMTHHMLAEFDRDWVGRCRNAFLIRAPERVVASYVESRAEPTLADIGAVQQRELFEAECDRLGRAPPVIDAADVLADPRSTLTVLCDALGLAFVEDMLSWPPGRRETDGVWAPAWYATVEASTGFSAPEHEQRPTILPDRLRGLADAAREHYEALSRWALRPG